MNRAISGTVVTAGTGRPLPGLILLALLLEPGEPRYLGFGRTGQMGRFRIQYPPIGTAADLTVLVYSGDGQFLYMEPVHRAIAGAELQIQIEVPRACLAGEIH